MKVASRPCEIVKFSNGYTKSGSSPVTIGTLTAKRTTRARWQSIVHCMENAMNRRRSLEPAAAPFIYLTLSSFARTSVSSLLTHSMPYPNRSSATKNPWHPPPLPLDHRSHSYPFIRRHLKKNTLKTLHDAVHTSCITQEITCPFECVTCPSPRGEHDGGTETRIPEGQPREQPTTLQLSNTRGLDTRAILLMQQNHHSYDSRKDKKKRKQTGQTKP